MTHDELMSALLLERHAGMPRWHLTSPTGRPTAPSEDWISGKVQLLPDPEAAAHRRVLVTEYPSVNGYDGTAERVA